MAGEGARLASPGLDPLSALTTTALPGSAHTGAHRGSRSARSCVLLHSKRGDPILVAPTEPLALRNIGKTSSLPEKFGVDFIFPTKHGLVGVQRKEISDLIASLRDGRLTRELILMKKLAIGMLIIEGQLLWSNDGQLLNSASWTRAHHRGLIWSIQSKGFWQMSTESMSETGEVLVALQRYLGKQNHNSLLTRPKASSDWGSPSDRDFGIHILQSFDGIGPEVAGRIYDEYKEVPLRWTITDLDLQQIPGIGPKRAGKMIKALNQEESTKSQE